MYHCAQITDCITVTMFAVGNTNRPIGYDL